MEKIQIKHFKFNLFEPSIQNRNGTTIIIYHGWGTNVESYNDVAEEIAKIGHRVVVPEIVYHDTRKSLENHYTAETTQRYFWKTIYHTIDEFDEFIKQLGVPLKKTVLVGSSMGGFIANGIFAKQKNLGGLVNINGSGSFVLSEMLFRENDNRTSLPFEEELVMKQYNPVEKTNCDSPVLLMHGDSDKTISIKGQEDYYQFLTEIENRENVNFLIYKNNNHQFSSEMVKDLLDWLVNHKF
ncbi:MAG: alpha/beta hydrolase family protein [Paenisporosarcina sp.]